MRARDLLLPLAWLYGAGIALRNLCYDTRILPVEGVETPVISVGNIAAGGTGKTPLVEHIVGILTGAGLRPAVLSRGYRRRGSGTLTVSGGRSLPAGADRAGDEPAQIARKFPGCVVVVDGDRVRGARFIERALSVDAIVLDDGFQHRALKRDLDIVVLDAGAGSDRLLPAGNGREPVSSTGRADIVVLNERPRDGGSGRTVAAKAPVKMRYALKGFRGPGGPTRIDDIRSGGCVAFCGIGTPSSFAALLREAGLAPAAFLAYPDHHRYSDADLAAVAEARVRTGAAFVVTTEKDLSRLEGIGGGAERFGPQLVAAEIEAVITEGAEILAAAVLRTAGRPRTAGHPGAAGGDGGTGAGETRPRVPA